MNVFIIAMTGTINSNPADHGLALNEVVHLQEDTIDQSRNKHPGSRDGARSDQSCFVQIRVLCHLPNHVETLYTTTAEARL